MTLRLTKFQNEIQDSVVLPGHIGQTDEQTDISLEILV